MSFVGMHELTISLDDMDQRTMAADDDFVLVGDADDAALCRYLAGFDDDLVVADGVEMKPDALVLRHQHLPTLSVPGDAVHSTSAAPIQTSVSHSFSDNNVTNVDGEKLNAHVEHYYLHQEFQCCLVDGGLDKHESTFLSHEDWWPSMVLDDSEKRMLADLADTFQLNRKLRKNSRPRNRLVCRVAKSNCPKVRRTSKKGKGNCKEKKFLELHHLQKVFHLPREHAALELNIGSTYLKKACRKLGIKRWPSRKLQSIDNHIREVAQLKKELYDATRLHISDKNSAMKSGLLQALQASSTKAGSLRAEIFVNPDVRIPDFYREMNNLRRSMQRNHCGSTGACVATTAVI
eukprot:SAG31_NODE_3110_length_4664_cov_16.074699_2_plen_348_part_00